MVSAASLPEMNVELLYKYCSTGVIDMPQKNKKSFAAIRQYMKKTVSFSTIYAILWKKLEEEGTMDTDKEEKTEGGAVMWNIFRMREETEILDYETSLKEYNRDKKYIDFSVSEDWNLQFREEIEKAVQKSRREKRVMAVVAVLLILVGVVSKL